jgi:hypothetical protein
VPEGVTPPLEKAAPEPGKRIKPGRGLPPCRSARSAAAPLSPREAVAEANDCVPHMLQVLNAARKAKLRVFYALHHRFRPGDYETWKYIAPVQKATWVHESFEYGTGGGEIRPEFEPKPGEVCCHGALVFQWASPTQIWIAAQEARRPSAHRHRTHRSYLHRSDRSLCR